MKKRINTIAFSLALATLSSNAFAEMPTQANMLAYACAACHGFNGNSQGPSTPNLAGISKFYFMDAMEAFKEGGRPATVMNRIAKGYSKDEIKLMAEFFSKQPLKPVVQAFDPALASKGQALHEANCAQCHENGGRASDDDAGILAGQMTPYLHFTINDILAGTREVPTKMLKKLEKVRDENGQSGIDQLIHFYASQK
ncbi:MAG TPA: c-type cytochrome [Gammaproteobacteria bacterium]